jgi:hypothetical protein
MGFFIAASSVMCCHGIIFIFFIAEVSMAAFNSTVQLKSTDYQAFVHCKVRSLTNFLWFGEEW